MPEMLMEDYIRSHIIEADDDVDELFITNGRVARAIANYIEKSRQRVEVVRCKDCLWFEEKKCDELGFCLENGKYWMENDYCSYGERSDNVNG